MRLTTAEEWDEAGGVLEQMIMTLMSTEPTAANKADLKTALASLQLARECLVRLNLYSEDFNATLYHY